MARPDKYSRYATGAGRTLEPAESKKTQGWEFGEEPPARFFNWIQNLVYLWGQYFDTEKMETVIPAGPHFGLKVTNGSSAGVFSISAGVLVAREGPRLEIATQTDFNPATNSNPGPGYRNDLVIVTFVWDGTSPATPTFSVIEGQNPIAPLAVNQYSLATLKVPNGTNVPDRIIHTARHSEFYGKNLGRSYSFQHDNSHRLVVADGVTANGDLEGLDGLQSAINELNARGGGVVELRGIEWANYATNPTSTVFLKSNVMIDGNLITLRPSDISAGSTFFRVEGVENIANNADIVNDVLIDTGKNFTSSGIGSIVIINDGAPADIGRVLKIAEISIPSEARLVDLFGDPAGLTGSTGNVGYTTLVIFAGIKNIKIDTANRITGSAIHLTNTTRCFFENIGFVNSVGTTPDAIRADGLNQNNFILDCEVNSESADFTNAISATGINDGFVITGLYKANISIVSSGTGEGTLAAEVTGTVTVPAAFGFRDYIWRQEHEIDGGHKATAGDGLSGGGAVAFDVNVDDSTIEIDTDTLRVKDLGIITGKLDALGVTTPKIADDAVTRIKTLQHPNLLKNPTAQIGNAFWDNEDSPGTTPNWLEFLDGSGGAIGAFWRESDNVAKKDLGDKIKIAAGVNLTLSAQMKLIIGTSVDFKLEVACFDSGDSELSQICVLTMSSTLPWTYKESIVEATPANTMYVRVRRYTSGVVGSYVADVRRIKVNGGDDGAAAYSDEASIPQRITARYKKGSSQNFVTGNIDIIDFDTKTFDDPRNNILSTRVTTGAAWKFTADRPMRIRVSACVGFIAGVNFDAGDLAKIRLTINDAAPFTSPPYSLLDEFRAQANISGNLVVLKGTDIIDLKEDDFISIYFTQNSGNTIALLDAATDPRVYINIEEIP